ncbi:heparinase II/III family protein [Catenulispora pinisilvae]|uniref:heparinase II/III family protein n=1 Tax=Catenulispora pinisilvae TaxID=2705253 RepID=UPI0018925DE7|nr:heparinase II/III family protein [Catenulispora pinisilvae]
MNYLAALEDEVREAVARAAGSAAPELTYTLYRQFGDTGHRYGYEHPYFERRGRLVAAGAAALFDVRAGGGDGADGADNADDADGAVSADVLAVLADELWRVCDEYTWALPAHEYHARDGDMRRCVDLFAAETAHTVAELIGRFGKQLPDDVTMRCREELLDRVFIPFADDQRPMAFEAMTNNWLAVVAGGVGMAALAFFPDDAKRLAMILKRAQKSLRRFIEHYPEDGGCSEGMDYWVYGFGYFAYFAEAWRERGGPDLLLDKKIREIAAFPARVGFGDGRFPSFSDGSENAEIPTGLMSRLVERLGVPVPYLATVPSLASDFCHRWPHVAKNIEWTSGRVLGKPTAPGAAYLPDLAWVVDRGGEAEFAAKGGHNDEFHNHLDVGTFILRGHGETFLADLGAGEYNADYFGPDRYKDIHTAAEGHSIPLIDGRGQLPGAEHAAEVERFADTGRGAILTLDLTSAYEVPGLLAVGRRFTWQRHGSLAVVDRIEADRPMPFEEVYISRIRPTIELADGVSSERQPTSGGTGSDGVAREGEPAAGGPVPDRVVWEGEKARCVLTFPAAMTPELETIETTGHRGELESVFRLRLRCSLEAGGSRLESVFTVERKER